MEISTLSAHQMAHGGLVAHTSSWTPAAYELEESALWNSDVGGLSELLDGRREQGDKVEYVLTDPTTGKPPETGAVQKYWNRGLPLIASGHSCLLALWFNASWRFCRFGSLFRTLRRHSGLLLRQQQCFDVAASLMSAVTAATILVLLFFDVCVLFPGPFSIAGNDETENVADLKDEFEPLERREVEVLRFAGEAKAPVGERHHLCHRLSMIRPRASRSSSHRDERWDGVSGLTRHARTRVLVDENGTESGGVDAQISVTASVDASGYENVSRSDPTFFLGRVFGVLFLSPACGCRFKSGPGRFWVGVCRPWFCPWSRFVSVGFNAGRKRAPTPEPAVIQRSLFGRQPFLFRCSGTLDLCIRSIASRRALGCELRDGSGGGRSPVPQGDNTGGRGYVHPPPTIAFWASRKQSFVCGVLVFFAPLFP